MKEWQCIGHNPTTWALGDNINGEMHNVIANVKRLKDGSWYFSTYNFSGSEPSRIEAMKTAEKFIKIEQNRQTTSRRV